MELLVTFLIGSLFATQAPETKSRTVWDGVYTEAQAARGKMVYENQCAICHGNDLAGTSAQALKGDTAFVEKWREDSVNSLFTRIRTAMPARAPGSLSDQNYLDVVSYLLQANSYPAGNEELRKDGL